MNCDKDSKIEPFKALQDCDTEAMDYQDCTIAPFQALQECDIEAMDCVQDCHTEPSKAQQDTTVEPFRALQDSNIEPFKALQDYETEAMDYQNCQLEPFKALQDSKIETFKAPQDCDKKALDFVLNSETKLATSFLDAPQQNPAARAKSVRFNPKVDVLYFHRQLSQDGIPMDKEGCPLGMAFKPFHRDTLPLPETSSNTKRVIHHYNSSQRRHMLLDFVMMKISTPSGYSELKEFADELSELNKSRTNSLKGCRCKERVCDLNTCPCVLNEIPCHMSTCMCCVGCGNAYGRLMTDRTSKRLHYDLTFRRLRLGTTQCAEKVVRHSCDPH